MNTKQTLKSGLHALTWREGKLFVAKCLEVEVVSQGKTKLEAIKNLEEALELYFEDEGLKPPKSLIDIELHSISSGLCYS
jgi:predicted RNase H-like HicB family nuclease